MLLSLLLTFASLDPSLQVQTQTHLVNTVDKVGIHMWVANNYAKEFVRRLNDPHWLKLHGPHRKTHQMIDEMIAKMIAESKPLVVPKEWAGITPYTPDEATTLLKAIRGLPGDQISAIMSKFEAERVLPKKD